MTLLNTEDEVIDLLDNEDFQDNLVSKFIAEVRKTDTETSDRELEVIMLDECEVYDLDGLQELQECSASNLSSQLIQYGLDKLSVRKSGEATISKADMDNFRLEFYDSLPFDHTQVDQKLLEEDFQNAFKEMDK